MTNSTPAQQYHTDEGMPTRLLYTVVVADSLSGHEAQRVLDALNNQWGLRVWTLRPNAIIFGTLQLITLVDGDVSAAEITTWQGFVLGVCMSLNL